MIKNNLEGMTKSLPRRRGAGRKTAPGRALEIGGPLAAKAARCGQMDFGGTALRFPVLLPAGSARRLTYGKKQSH